MKKVRCPRCAKPITFDETRYEEGHSLVFECPSCHKRFGVKLRTAPASAPNDGAKDTTAQTNVDCGALTVIENVFHYKQTLPLHLGDNTVGRYMKGSKTQLAIETDDPSMDMLHCVIHVRKDSEGKCEYILRDGPSNTGTFVGDVILGKGERRLITPGTLFTLGATSIILKGVEE